MTEVELKKIGKEIDELGKQIKILDGSNVFENHKLEICINRLDYLIFALRAEINKPKTSYLRLMN